MKYVTLAILSEQLYLVHKTSDFMQKGFLILLITLAHTSIFAQKNESGTDFLAGLNVYGGWNLPVRLTTKYITEDTSPWHGNLSWSAGAQVSWMASEFYRIEIAPRYSWHKTGFELSPPIYDEKTIYTETFSLITIPVTLKRYLENGYFIRAGTMADIPFKEKPEYVDPQSGLGLILGAGREFRFGDLVLDISPVAELHSVVPFSHADNQQRLFLAAFRIGISYKLNTGMKKPDRENTIENMTPLEN
jgi:hypothetical protein